MESRCFVCPREEHLKHQMGSLRVLHIVYWTVSILLMMLQTPLSVGSVEVFRELPDFGLLGCGVEEGLQAIVSSLL